MFENAVLLLPSYGGMFDQHVLSVANSACQALHVFGAPIDQARNYLVELALAETDKDVFVFIDADISFSREDLALLVDDCTRTKSIVSGIYVLKNGTNRIVAHAPNPEITEEGLISAQWIGMGFCAIHRDALRRIAGNLSRVKLSRPSEMIEIYPFFLPLIHDNMYFGEDYSFCVRANEAGVPIYLNNNILVTHWGLQGYRLQK